MYLIIITRKDNQRYLLGSGKRQTRSNIPQPLFWGSLREMKRDMDSRLEMLSGFSLSVIRYTEPYPSLIKTVGIPPYELVKIINGPIPTWGIKITEEIDQYLLVCEELEHWPIPQLPDYCLGIWTD